MPAGPEEGDHQTGEQYIINVIFTRVGQKFKDWVDARVNQRHEEVKVEGKKYIELDPEVAQVFYANKAVSTKNGCSYHLFKATAKRRRTKQEIKDQELEEARKKADMEDKIKRFDAMEQKMAQLQQQMQSQQGVLDQANSLYEQGLIK